MTIYDVVVVGAGAGGMTAAARLTAAGKKVLLVESRDRLGGRASSENIEGFIVNLGAIALSRGGIFEETLNLLGVELDIREPSPAAIFRIGGKLVDVSRGGLGMLLGSITKQAAKIGAKFVDARAGDLPEERLTTEAWLRRYTKNATVHALFRNICASFFAANASELPARAFLVRFAVKGMTGRLGFCPRGTIGVWNDLGDGIRKAGSDIWLDASVTALHVNGGQVEAVDINRGKDTEKIFTRAVISNIGPSATVKLGGAEAFGASYVAEAQRLPRPAAMIVVNFATRQRLIDTPALITFGRTRRLCMAVELTATCPELAPAGWHQYVAYAVPIPAIGSFDEKQEIELSLQDLRDEFPGFDQAKMLSIKVMRDEWPAQRSCAGYDMPQETPLPNLWHVGDAVKDYGDGGTSACAETGKKAAEYALSWLSKAPQIPKAAV